MEYFKLHAENPQKRVINQAIEQLKAGGVIVYPTDSAYALGCMLDNRAGVETIRLIRNLKENHPLTLMCSNIAQAAHYAKIDDPVYKVMKKWTPGPYTFLLMASKNIFKIAQGSKRKEVGIRIPGHPIALQLVEELGQPILSSTLWLEGDEEPIEDVNILLNTKLKINLVLDAGECHRGATTIIDMLGESPKIVRKGSQEKDDIELYL